MKNGNGIPGQARDIRSGLCLEGYNVVNIGNHIDFGLEATVIAYRPGAARVAQNLARNFFPTPGSRRAAIFPIGPTSASLQAWTR